MSVVATSDGVPDYQSVLSVAGESHLFAGATCESLPEPLSRSMSEHSWMTANSRVVLNFDQLTTQEAAPRKCCSCACLPWHCLSDLFADSGPKKKPELHASLLADYTMELAPVDEQEEMLAIDGDPAGLQRLVDILLHKFRQDSNEELEVLERKLRTPFIELSEFTVNFRSSVRKRMTAMDFRQMLFVVESIASPMRQNRSFNTVLDIFMNQWNVKVRPVAMHLEEYKACTKKFREYNKKALTEEEKQNGEQFDELYRNTNLRKLMDLDKDARVINKEGGPLSVQAITWAKCIIDFIVSIFNLFLKVCPQSTDSISAYLEHVEKTGTARSLSPYMIFGDSNLYRVLPLPMRIMVSTALRGSKIGPQQIFSDQMVQVFGDSIRVVRTLLDDLRAVTCLLSMLLEADH